MGTVRSRLSRARDRLRDRLSRRGLAAPAVAGPIGAWLAGKEAGVSALAGTLTGGSAAAVPEGAAKLVLKLASQAANGSISGTAMVPVTSQILAEGVLKMITLKKLTVIATVLLSVATLTGGGGLAVIRASRAQQAQTKQTSVEQKKAPPVSGQGAFLKNDDVDPQMQEMVELARLRYELVRQTFEGGEISVERMIDAALELDRVELRAATNPAARRELRERSFKRLERLEQHVEARVKEGNAKTSDAVAVKLRRIEAELELKMPEEQQTGARASELKKATSPADPAKIAAAAQLAAQNQELVRLAHEHFEIEYKAYLAGDLPMAGIIAACDVVENAELRAGNPARTLSAIKESSLNRFKAIEQPASVGLGRTVTQFDFNMIKRRRLQAEIDLKTPDNQKIDAPVILRRLRELEQKVRELEEQLARHGQGGSK